MGGPRSVFAPQSESDVAPPGVVLADVRPVLRIEDDRSFRIDDIDPDIHARFEQIVDLHGKGPFVSAAESRIEALGREAAVLHFRADQCSQDIGLIDQGILDPFHVARAEIPRNPGDRIVKAGGEDKQVGKENTGSQPHRSSRSE